MPEAKKYVVRKRLIRVFHGKRARCVDIGRPQLLEERLNAHTLLQRHEPDPGIMDELGQRTVFGRGVHSMDDFLRLVLGFCQGFLLNS